MRATWPLFIDAIRSLSLADALERSVYDNTGWCVAFAIFSA
jgi:hypothetical protein